MSGPVRGVVRWGIVIGPLLMSGGTVLFLQGLSPSRNLNSQVLEAYGGFAEALLGALVFAGGLILASRAVRSNWVFGRPEKSLPRLSERPENPGQESYSGADIEAMVRWNRRDRPRPNVASEASTEPVRNA